MQWDSSKNLGFSTADESKLYLPVDKNADAPTVENNKGVEGSVYENLKCLIALRHENEDLRNASDFELIHAEKGDSLFIYKRGQFTVYFNVSNDKKEVKLEDVGEIVFMLGEYDIDNETLILKGRNAVIIKE